MPNLRNISEKLLKEHHPVLDPSVMGDGEHVFKEGPNGTRVMAHVAGGKLSKLAVAGREKIDSLMVTFRPPDPILPDHRLVCVCVMYSSDYGEGVDCGWVPDRSLGD